MFEFASANKNVHRQLKDCAELHSLAKKEMSAHDEFQPMVSDAIKEIRRLRRVAVDHAEISLQLMENSLTVPASSTPVRPREPPNEKRGTRSPGLGKRRILK